jgi:hypothetical protein
MFNPNDHMMKLKGKDYLQVMWRLVWFREDHPDFGIDTSALSIDENHAVFKCAITDPNGIQVSAGHGSESKKDFGDFIEKAETKAVGRALAMLGYGTQFAADELDEGERIVDSPINRAPKKQEEEKIELPKAGSWNPNNAATMWAKNHGIKIESLNNMRMALIAGGVVKDIPVGQLSPVDFDTLCKAIEANYADQLKVSA